MLMLEMKIQHLSFRNCFTKNIKTANSSEGVYLLIIYSQKCSDFCACLLLIIVVCKHDRWTHCWRQSGTTE